MEELVMATRLVFVLCAFLASCDASPPSSAVDAESSDVGACPPTSNQTTPCGDDPYREDKDAILALMEDFQDAIRNQDPERMSSLFLDGNIVWVGAGHPESHRFYQGQDPTLRQVQQGGAYQLLGSPGFASQTLEEVFFRPTIDTDGQVGLASFDYVFKVNGEASNWGREYWQLAKVGPDWKIVHLIYSYHAVEVKPVPESFK
jgi:ketosteroid isomerase-like protein